MTIQYVDPNDVRDELKSREARKIFNMINMLGPRWHISANQYGRVVLTPDICMVRKPKEYTSSDGQLIKPNIYFYDLPNPMGEHARDLDTSILGLKRSFIYARKQGAIFVVNPCSGSTNVFECKKGTGILVPSTLEAIYK